MDSRATPKTKQFFYNYKGDYSFHLGPVFDEHVAFMVGKGAKTLKMIRKQTGAHCQIMKSDQYHPLPWFLVRGSIRSILGAVEKLLEIRGEADRRMPVNAKIPRGRNVFYDSVDFDGRNHRISYHFGPIHEQHIPFIVGKGARTLSAIRKKTGAHCQIMQPDNFHDTPWLLVRGSIKGVIAAVKWLSSIRKEAFRRMPVDFGVSHENVQQIGYSPKMGRTASISENQDGRDESSIPRPSEYNGYNRQDSLSELDDCYCPNTPEYAGFQEDESTSEASKEQLESTEKEVKEGPKEVAKEGPPKEEQTKKRTIRKVVNFTNKEH